MSLVGYSNGIWVASLGPQVPMKQWRFWAFKIWLRNVRTSKNEGFGFPWHHGLLGGYLKNSPRMVGIFQPNCWTSRGSAPRANRSGMLMLQSMHQHLCSDQLTRLTYNSYYLLLILPIPSMYYGIFNLHEWLMFYGFHVGKYIPYMDCLGWEIKYGTHLEL